MKRGMPKGFKILSDEYLINKLKEAFVIFGRIPSSKQIRKDKRFPSLTVYTKRFGSWNKALLSAGLEPMHRWREGKTRHPRLKRRFLIFKRDNFTCQYCGRTPQDRAKLVIDHKNPLSNGGLTEEDNLITSCFECNAGKKDLLLLFPKRKADPA